MLLPTFKLNESKIIYHENDFTNKVLYQKINFKIY